ncbi:GDSL-type esterase/lipase family protein [Yersinia ruckeri]|uniref:cytidylyltransferase domain-containing protein n=1 Tax=Yersinia ruckeri TaxID=29486 RepID=UPI0020BF5CEE|nr:GDSL-type esterase/lipase family protein [Yersinia ruckeri]MCK8584843.1 GDSL-type esterase/lipase family protein [Yersinia ruckeri]
MNYKKIAIIPARSGSKGLPSKNILTLIDRPLIAYTIQAAIESNEFDRVIVSTDSIEYKDISEQYGAEVILRGANISSDTSTSFMVIKDVLLRQDQQPDYFVLLQPTSPFRNSSHIKDAITQFEDHMDANFLVSVTESNKSSSLIKMIDDDLSMCNFDFDFSTYRRQKYKEYYPNGAIFIGKTDEYLSKEHFFGKDSLAFLMSKEDSIDIDDELDFLLAITIATKNKNKLLLKEKIEDRINEKKTMMQQVTPITLIGHSIFDYWDIENINGKRINNLGVAGINTYEYLELVLKKNKITEIGDVIFLLSGTNDIVIDGWKKDDTLNWIEQTYVELIKINKNITLTLLSVPYVRGRMDRKNKVIKELNDYLKDNISSEIGFIDITTELSDKYENLRSEYTTDGLHFTDLAYNKLKEILSKVI